MSEQMGFIRSNEADKESIRAAGRLGARTLYQKLFGTAETPVSRQLRPEDLNQLGDTRQAHPGFEYASFGSVANDHQVIVIWAVQVDPRDISQITTLEIVVADNVVALVNLTSLYMPVPFEKSDQELMEKFYIHKPQLESPWTLYYFDPTGWLEAPVLIPARGSWRVRAQANGDASYRLVFHGEVLERPGVRVMLPVEVVLGFGEDPPVQPQVPTPSRRPFFKRPKWWRR